MNGEGHNPPHVHVPPVLWLSCPNIGEPVVIHHMPNIFLIPMKIPLQESLQAGFPEECRWTIAKAEAETMRRLNLQRRYVTLVCIEFGSTGGSCTPAEWAEHGIELCTVPIGDDYSPSSLTAFCDVITRIPSPGRVHGVMVCCRNGYNRTGFGIAGFLMWHHKVSARIATSVFAQARPPGIFNARAIETLNEFGKGGDLAQTPPGPAWSKFRQETVSIAASGLQVEVGPYLTGSRGEKVMSGELSRTLQTVLKSAIGGKMKRPAHAEYSPQHRIWTQDKMEELTKNPFLCTYVPRGTPVFLLVTEPECVYVSYGRYRIWKFAAKHNVATPTVCLGMVVEVAGKFVLFVLDILMHAGIKVDRIDVDDRLALVWYEVLSKIEKCAINLRFRAMAKITAISKVLETLTQMQVKEGFKCEGVALVSQLYSVGFSLFIPVRPSLKLKFILNTNTLALLLGRTENASALVPFTLWQLSTDKYRGLNNHIVRFEIAFTPEVSLIPVSICDNEICDYVSYAVELLNFYRSGLRYDQTIREIERAARAERH